MKRIIIGLILGMSIFFLVKVVYAQQLNLSLTPPQVEILMKPNISLIKTFTLENLGDMGIFSVRIVSFEPQGDQGGRVIKEKIEGPLRFSLENEGLDFNQKFVLDSGKKFQAIVKMRTVEQAPEGDYYYLILFTSEPPVSQDSNSLSKGTIGANILVSVTKDGLTEVKAQVSQLQIIPRYKLRLFGQIINIVETSDEVPVLFKIANVGNYLIAPETNLTLRGPYVQDTKVSLLPVNILKQSERLLVPENTPNCIRCQIPVSTVYKGFFLGKYTISAEIGFANSNQKIYESTVFWGLPLKLIFFLIIILIVFIVVLIYLIRKRKYKHK